MRLAAVFLIFVCQAAADSACSAEKPNVVVFYADDLGWADWERHPTLNPTGSVVYETPNLLRLAQSGLNFTEAYASAPICSPSRVALLTGKTPARTGVTDFLGGGRNTSGRLRSPTWSSGGMSGSEVTIAESLGSSAGGYDTGFIGKWHAGGNPLSQGYDTNVAGGGRGCPCDGEGGFFAGPDGRWAGMPGIDTPGTYASDAYLTDVLAGFAENYIQQKAVDPDPFFLTFAPYQVHVPLQAPAAIISKYANKMAQLQGQGIDLEGHDVPVYAAMVEEMDTALGRVLDRLEDPNGDGNPADSVRDNTIVVFASDNGGLTVSELGSPPATENRPLRAGKGSVYEGGIRTTFLASWTGNEAVSQGVTTTARVSTHDLYPTLLELTGADSTSAPRNTTIDGVSFASALEGGAHERGTQFWHYPHRSNQQRVSAGTVTGGSFVSAARDDSHKLIFFYEDRSYELYDLSADVGETNDLLAGAGPASEDAFRLSVELNRYLTGVGAAMPIDRFTNLAEAAPDILWPTFQGDFDANGTLDAADWARLRDAFGSDFTDQPLTAGYSSGDINVDGVIDRFDFDLFKSIYEDANGAGSFSQLLAGVPEPTAGVIAAAMILGSGLRGGRAAR